MVTKTIEIDGSRVTFAASSGTLRRYRDKFQRDMMQDMDKLVGAMSGNSESESTLGIGDLEIFENVAYVMAKQADPTVPDDIYDWLDKFEIFSIYQILPHIIELWGLNMETMTDAKKKQEQPTGQ